MLSNCRLVGNFYLYYIKHLWLVQEPLCPWTFNTLNITFLLSFCIRSPLTYTQHLTHIRAHTHTFPLCPSHCPPGLSVVVFLALAQCPSCKHSLTFSTSVQPPSLSHVKSTHPRLAYTHAHQDHTFQELMPGSSKTWCSLVFLLYLVDGHIAKQTSTLFLTERPEYVEFWTVVSSESLSNSTSKTFLVNELHQIDSSWSVLEHSHPYYRTSMFKWFLKVWVVDQASGIFAPRPQPTFSAVCLC